MKVKNKIRNGINFTLRLNVSNQITFKVVVLSIVSISYLCPAGLNAQDMANVRHHLTIAADQDDLRKEVPVEDLPAEISEDVLKKYPGSTIVEAWKWLRESGEIEKYELKIQSEGKDFYLNYTPDGEAIKIEE